MFFVFPFRILCFLVSVRMMKSGVKAMNYKITHQGENAYVSINGIGFPSYVDAVWLGRIVGALETVLGLIGIKISIFDH